jgi:hypothetical protein
MLKQFVIAVCDVRCKEFNPNFAPKYRCYVNDELFVERTWIWENMYLEESLQLLAEPGKYRVRYELVDGDDGTVEFSNLRIEHGPAMIIRQSEIYIHRPKDENP